MPSPPDTGEGRRRHTARKLAPLVYDRLHDRATHLMTGERVGHTLQATVLLHESILRLGGFDEPLWDSKWHFLGAAFQAMRRTLIDHSRRRSADKAGGKLRRHAIDGIDPPAEDRNAEITALLEAVEKLSSEEPEAALLVNLVYIAGLTIKEAAAELEMSPETAKRRLRFAKAWLASELDDDQSLPPAEG